MSMCVIVYDGARHNGKASGRGVSEHGAIYVANIRIIHLLGPLLP